MTEPRLVFIDMRCGNCGHPPEGHHAGKGQCYRCAAEKRCPAWMEKSADALLVSANEDKLNRWIPK